MLTDLKDREQETSKQSPNSEVHQLTEKYSALALVMTLPKLPNGDLLLAVTAQARRKEEFATKPFLSESQR